MKPQEAVEVLRRELLRESCGEAALREAMAVVVMDTAMEVGP